MWCRSLSSCFLASFPISFVTISICRFLWRYAFLIYAGVSTMSLSTLFWIRWMMTVLLCFVYPHSLCRRSTQASVFVCTASAYYVSTGPIFPLANTFSCVLVQTVRVFFLTCAFQRSLAPRMRTSYLILRYAFACSYWSGCYLSVRWLKSCFPHTHEYHREAETAPASVRCQVTNWREYLA